MNFLNKFLNCKSSMLLKVQYQRLKRKLTCESNPSEKYEQNITNKLKQKNTLP